MGVSRLTQQQHEAVFDAVLRTLWDVEPDLLDAGRTLDPGGLVELDSHIDDLHAAIHRTAAAGDLCLAEILDEICSTCRYQYPTGYCPLRQRNLCVLHRHASRIITAVAVATRQSRDEASNPNP
jgi:hypothetical protein